mmetsp:Transcript_66049/g.97810  ORF Transcript_66049/g.97810 Transcript_66049/m.97810 type:complete len:118 (+) Transcript_66049:99-452(+)
MDFSSSLSSVRQSISIQPEDNLRDTTINHAVQLLWDKMALVSDLEIFTLAFLLHGVVVHLVKENSHVTCFCGHIEGRSEQLCMKNEKEGGVNVTDVNTNSADANVAMCWGVFVLRWY